MSGEIDAALTLETTGDFEAEILGDFEAEISGDVGAVLMLEMTGDVGPALANIGASEMISGSGIFLAERLAKGNDDGLRC